LQTNVANDSSSPSLPETYELFARTIAAQDEEARLLVS